VTGFVDVLIAATALGRRKTLAVLVGSSGVMLRRFGNVKGTIGIGSVLDTGGVREEAVVVSLDRSRVQTPKILVATSPSPSRKNFTPNVSFITELYPHFN